MYRNSFFFSVKDRPGGALRAPRVMSDLTSEDVMGGLILPTSMTGGGGGFTIQQAPRWNGRPAEVGVPCRFAQMGVWPCAEVWDM